METKTNLNLKQEADKVANFKVGLVELSIELNDHDFISAKIIADNLWKDVGDFANVSGNLNMTKEVFSKPNTSHDYMVQFYDLYNSIINLIRVLMNKSTLVNETSFINADLRIPYKSFKSSKNPYICYQMNSRGDFNRFYIQVISQVALRFHLCQILVHNLETEIDHKRTKNSKMKFISTDVIAKNLKALPIHYKKCKEYLNAEKDRCILKLGEYGFDTSKLSKWQVHTAHHRITHMLISDGVYCNNIKAFMHQPISKWF